MMISFFALIVAYLSPKHRKVCYGIAVIGFLISVGIAVGQDIAEYGDPHRNPKLSVIRNTLGVFFFQFPVMLIMLGIAFLAYKFFFNKGGGIFGALGSQQASDTHGSARWATDNEIAQLAKPANTELSQGALDLAPFNESYLELPRSIVTRHLMVFGPSGAGKSRSIFMPNLIESNGQSFASTDPKGELYKISSGYHQIVRRYAPTEPHASECFNWIPRCSDIRIAQKIGTALASQKSHSTDPFWTDAESALYAALFAHTATLQAPTPATALNLLTELETKELIATLSNSPSRVARQMIGVFKKAGEKVQGSVLIAAANRMMFLSDEAVAKFTSSSTTGADFKEMRRHPIGVYFVIPESDTSRLQGLITMFFTLMLHDLKEEQPEVNYQVPCTIFFDEFANVGSIPNFATEITVCRGRDIAFVLGVQSVSQIEALYGRENARTIIENCQTRIALAGLGFESAREVSQALGKQTIVTQSRSVTPTGLIQTSVTNSASESARDLLTPDEVRQIGEREMIVISTNRRPMWLHTWFELRQPNPAPARALAKVIEQRFEDNGSSYKTKPLNDDDFLEPPPLVI
jgi:type IV secretion system protein VirD4